MDLLEGFSKFIKSHRLSPDEGNFTLLTVSGGLDSVVLAYLFKAASLPFAIAHCNFQLRDAESNEEELFVQALAHNFGVLFFKKDFETKDYAEKNGLSTQMAARELRYKWFEEIVAKNGFTHIATAHHLNDSVETVLLNFVRGTGLAGISGMRPKTGNLLRPLIFASRKDILEFAQANGIVWREDSSNASDDYSRNFVRHHIVQHMEAINPNFLRTAERNMERMGEARDNLAFLLQNWFQIDSLTSSHTINIQPISINKQKLSQLPAPQQALRQVLKSYGFDAEQARQLAENLDHTGLELNSNTGWQLLNDRTEILLRLFVQNTPDQMAPTIIHHASFIIQPDDLMVSLPDGSRLFLMPLTCYQSPIAQSTDRQTITVDAEKLKFPLHLRHWKPGDSFQPFGMGGKSQKLQDFFTNQKLSRFEKEEIWLLVNGDETVVWVLGWRLDERYKIDAFTNKTMKINWIK